MSRRPPLRFEASNAFVAFLKNEDNLKGVTSEQDGMFKRDDLRMLYNSRFLKTEAATSYQSVKYRDCIRSLRYRKVVFELGDYYSFASDIQVLYEKLATSEEYQKVLDTWKENAKENPNFCSYCGLDCGNEASFEQHCVGNRHRIHKLQSAIYMSKFVFISTHYYFHSLIDCRCTSLCLKSHDNTFNQVYLN